MKPDVSICPFSAAPMMKFWSVAAMAKLKLPPKVPRLLIWLFLQTVATKLGDPVKASNSPFCDSPTIKPCALIAVVYCRHIRPEERPGQSVSHCAIFQACCTKHESSKQSGE